MINHGNIDYNFPQTAQSQSNERQAGNLNNYTSNSNVNSNFNLHASMSNGCCVSNTGFNTNNTNNNTINTNSGFHISNANANSNGYLAPDDIDTESRRTDIGSNKDAVTKATSSHSISDATKESLVIFATQKYIKCLKNLTSKPKY